MYSGWPEVRMIRFKIQTTAFQSFLIQSCTKTSPREPERQIEEALLTVVDLVAQLETLFSSICGGLTVNMFLVSFLQTLSG